MKLKWFLLFLFIIELNHAQTNEYNTSYISIDSLIDGTLIIPTLKKEIPLVIIIQGSGPTDRNGNQLSLNNNSLKYLAEALYDKKIASFRYDKRYVKQVNNGTFDESKVLFTHFIEDAKNVIKYFKNDERFSEIIIIGHSQGSLVGMIAAQNNDVSKFISLAGAGQEIDDVVVDQLRNQAPNLVDNARISFDDLRVNGVSTNYNQLLASIFRPSIQPFMYSWMKYNPQVEISKLDIPILILNGDNDIQVQVSEAEKLKEANPEAELVIIPNMNHVLKEIKGDLMENQQSYNQVELPISKKLIRSIHKFILK